MKKAVKAGIIGAGALGYSIIPTYLMKYHWIIRDKKMAKKEEKVLYLTFDDGPDTVYTNKLLDLLEQEQVPATFFLLGENAEQYGEQVRMIAEQGHLIGNHTWRHVQVTSLPKEEAEEEILAVSSLVEELTGNGTSYVRPPFGIWDPELEEELDMIPVLWTIDTLDWTTQNVDWIVEKTVQDAGENDIILMHDSYESTVQAAERIIRRLKAEGFEFVTVDQVIMD